MNCINQINRNKPSHQLADPAPSQDASDFSDLSRLCLNRRGFFGVLLGVAVSGTSSAQAQKRLDPAPEVPRWDMYAWFPKELFDRDGYLSRPTKNQFVLGNGNALQALIMAVAELKEANGGMLPEGYQLKVVTEVNGRFRKESPIPLELLPRSVTPDSLGRFRSHPDGRRATDILSEDYMAVTFVENDKGTKKLEFFKGEIPARLKEDPRYRTDGNRTRNHFYVELVAPGGRRTGTR